MSEELPELSRHDTRMVERIAETLEPPVLTGARKAELNHALYERAEGGSARHRLWWMLPAPAAAALALGLFLSPQDAVDPEIDWIEPLWEATEIYDPVSEDTNSNSDWSWLESPDPLGELTEVVPEEYQAVAWWVDLGWVDTTDSEQNQGAEKER